MDATLRQNWTRHSPHRKLVQILKSWPITTLLNPVLSLKSSSTLFIMCAVAFRGQTRQLPPPLLPSPPQSPRESDLSSSSTATAISTDLPSPLSSNSSSPTTTRHAQLPSAYMSSACTKPVCHPDARAFPQSRQLPYTLKSHQPQNTCASSSTISRDSKSSSGSRESETNRQQQHGRSHVQESKHLSNETMEPPNRFKYRSGHSPFVPRLNLGRNAGVPCSSRPAPCLPPLPPCVSRCTSAASSPENRALEHCISNPIPMRSSSPSPTSLPPGFDRSVSKDERGNFKSSSLFLEPLSAGRLPKARVFVHRDKTCLSDLYSPQNPVSSQNSAAGGVSPISVATKLQDTLASGKTTEAVRNKAPAAPVLNSRGRPYSSNRPNYFFHARGQLYRGRVETEGETRSQTDLVRCPQSLPAMSRRSREIPFRIPPDELRDWEPTPWRNSRIDTPFVDEHDCTHDFHQMVDADDPCLDTHSRWGQSFRSISFLHRSRDYGNSHALQASVQNLPPPTLTERFGINSIGLVCRKNSSRATHSSAQSEVDYPTSSHVCKHGSGCVHTSPQGTDLECNHDKLDFTSKFNRRHHANQMCSTPPTPKNNSMGTTTTGSTASTPTKLAGRRLPRWHLHNHHQNHEDNSDVKSNDDYVGFLIDGTTSFNKSKRSSWLRFLRRKRGSHD